MIKLATLNILNDLSQWSQRRSILAAQMAELQPDVITLQEVTLIGNNACWLADQLGGYHVSLCPRTGNKRDREGIAILSRWPFKHEATLDLQTQQRVAQQIEIDLNARSLIVANTHLFWRPGESSERDAQARSMLNWLDNLANPANQCRAFRDGQPSPGSAVVVCGDFNATPNSTAIRIMRERFTSAYAARHGAEPEYTCPTPLAVDTIQTPRDVARSIRRLAIRIIGNRSLKPWRGTLDYIFVNRHVRVLDCQIVLNRPSPHNPKIYPSDHFGLMATLQL